MTLTHMRYTDCGCKDAKHRERIPSNMENNVPSMLVTHVAVCFHLQATPQWPI
jgi:hypothetical protein